MTRLVLAITLLGLLSGAAPAQDVKILRQRSAAPAPTTDAHLIVPGSVAAASAPGLIVPRGVF